MYIFEIMNNKSLKGIEKRAQIIQKIILVRGRRQE